MNSRRKFLAAMTASELLYTGITNLDLRMRATWLKGDVGSVFRVHPFA